MNEQLLFDAYKPVSIPLPGGQSLEAEPLSYPEAIRILGLIAEAQEGRAKAWRRFLIEFPALLMRRRAPWWLRWIPGGWRFRRSRIFDGYTPAEVIEIAFVFFSCRRTLPSPTADERNRQTTASTT